MYRKTYIEVNLDNLATNVKSIISKFDDYKYYIAVVKGNGYGHGLYIGESLIDAGANYLAVSSLEEAKEIRNYNKTIPVLCLQPIDLDCIIDAVKYKVTITIHSFEYLKALLAMDVIKTLKVHLKIDSGMNRLGFKDKHEVKEAINLINKDKELELEGIFSHFATSGYNDKHWDNQLESFKEITSLINLSKIPIVHLYDSMSLLSHTKLDFCNGIRMGIVMYGYNICYKSPKGIKSMLGVKKHDYLVKKYGISEVLRDIELDLKAALSLYTEIIQIKDVKKGEYIGYDATYQAKEDMKIAILPIGYEDGIGKRNKGRYVFINNKKYSVIGNIAMCMMAIKVDSSVKISDAVMVIGKNVSMGTVCKFNNISWLELLTTIGKTLPRVYTKEGKIDYILECKR